MWQVVSDGKQFSERPCFVKAGRRRSGTCRSRACKWEDGNGDPPEGGVGSKCRYQSRSTYGGYKLG